MSKFSTRSHIPRAEQYPDLRLYDQFDLWSRVLGKRVMEGDKFCNPFRNDTRPDCRLFVGYGQIVRISDWAWPEVNGLDVIKFAAYVWGVEPLRAAYRLLGDKILKVQKTTYYRPHYRPFLRYEFCDWRDADKLYWSAYGISRSTLESNHTFAVRRVWISSRVTGQIFDKATPAPSTVTVVGRYAKVYQPKSEISKFYSTLMPGCVAGRPASGDTLYITKFVKDCSVLNTAGFPSVFTAGENDAAADAFLQAASRTYSRIIHLTDNDEGGAAAKQHLDKAYRGRVDVVQLPGAHKDAADVVKYASQSELRYIIRNV